jgi:glucose/arabinose dehydrogenase
LTLERVAAIDEPVAMAYRSGEPSLYVAEKTGRIWRLPEQGQPTVVLDISGEVSLASEQGLLGLAFSPGGGEYLYINYTDLRGDTRIHEFAMLVGRPDPGSRREVLVVDQPFSNHNGGDLTFGPDGYLYIGLGDGGSGGDPDGNGQSLDTLLGKMLRIDPSPSDGEPYGIPSDNPFVGRVDARPEIWAYGLRNPWRYSFDRETGDLWIGDVGQNAWEEIDLEPASSDGGENYGWNAREGTHPFSGDRPDGAIDPVYEYANGTGACAVTGGYVYRGSAIPALQGAYLFADFCGGVVRALRPDGDGFVHESLGLETPNISSFGEDQDGELYVLSFGVGVLKIVAPS